MKTAAAFFGAELDRPPTQEVVAYINAYRDRFGVEPICEVLQVAPSTYYAAEEREPSRRRLRDDELIVEIRRVFHANYAAYGARTRSPRATCRPPLPRRRRPRLPPPRRRSKRRTAEPNRRRL